MPKEDIRARVAKLAEQNDHVAIVSLCTQALEQRQKLSRDDRIFALRTKAKHLAAIQPEVWQREIRSALTDALDEAAGDAQMEAKLLASLSFADIALVAPLQIESIVRRFEALAERHPDVMSFGGDIYYNLGLTYSLAKDFSSAESRYARALEIYRENYTRTNKPSEALKAGEALHNLSRVYLRTGRIEQAKAAVEEAHRSIPPEYGHARYLSRQGEIAHAEGDLNSARSCFEAAIAHSSADDWTKADALLNWAETELSASNRECAGALARKALLIAYQLPYRVAKDELETLIARIEGDDC